MHDAVRKSAHRIIFETDRKKRRGTEVAKPADQSPTHCATTLRSECSIRLDVLSAQIKGSNGCMKTHALLDTDSCASAVQMELLEMVGLRASPASLSRSLTAEHYGIQELRVLRELSFSG